MSSRIFSISRLGFIALVIWVAVDVWVWRGDGTFLRIHDGLENRDERLYGNWYWYDHALAFLGNAFAIVLVAVGGWLAGRLWIVRKYSDLPSLIQRFTKESDFKEIDFNKQFEMPSRKEVLKGVAWTIPIIIAFIWLIVTP